MGLCIIRKSFLYVSSFLTPQYKLTIYVAVIQYLLLCYYVLDLISPLRANPEQTSPRLPILIKRASEKPTEDSTDLPSRKHTFVCHHPRAAISPPIDGHLPKSRWSRNTFATRMFPRYASTVAGSLAVSYLSLYNPLLTLSLLPFLFNVVQGGLPKNSHTR